MTRQKENALHNVGPLVKSRSIMRITKRLFAMTAIGLTSCSLIEGGPPIADNVWLLRPNVKEAAIDQNFTPTACPQNEDEADGGNKTRKDFTDAAVIDKCIFAWINLIDVRYINFENQLFGSATNTNFVTDSALLGIGGAGAFFSGGAAQVMNGVSAGLTGFRSKFDQDILYSKTISVLIQQMRNDRSNALDIILKRVNATRSAAATPTGTQTTVKQAATSAAAQAATSAAQSVSAAAASADQPGATATDVKNAAAAAAQSAPAAATVAAAPPAATPYSNIYEAATDLHNYAIAGSWSHALIQMETDTAASAAAAKDNVTATKTGTATK